MDKKDILLGKFIGCQYGFCLITKSTNENDIYYVTDGPNSKTILENYDKLSIDTFENYINNLQLTAYKLGTRVVELQSVTNQNDYDRLIDRVFSNSRSVRIKFKDVIDRVYTKYNLDLQIDNLKKQIKNLEK